MPLVPCDILVLSPADQVRGDLAERLRDLGLGAVNCVATMEDALPLLAGGRHVVLGDPAVTGGDVAALVAALPEAGGSVGVVLLGAPLSSRAPDPVVGAVLPDASDLELGLAIGRAAQFAVEARTVADAERDLDELATLMPNTAAMLYGPDYVCRMARGPLIALTDRRGIQLVGLTVQEQAGPMWEAIRPYWEAAMRGSRQRFDYPMPGTDEVYTADLIPRRAGGRVVSVVCVTADVTAQRAAEHALAAEHAALAEAQAMARVGSWRICIESRDFQWSDEMCRIFGRAPGDPPADFDALLAHIHPEDRPLLRRTWTQSQHRPPGLIELYFRIVHPSGASGYLHLRAHAERDANGTAIAVKGVVQDVTERQEAELALRAAQRRFEAAFDEAPIGMVLMDADGRNVRANRAICELTGHGHSALMAMRHGALGETEPSQEDLEALRDLLAGTRQRWSAERRLIGADGRATWVQISTARLQLGPDEPPMVLSHYLDISHRHRLERRLRHLAEHDPLTGVPNRRAWDSQVPQAIDAASSTGKPLALALLDLNDFKSVNDTLGHDAGDRVLREVAASWRAQLRESDLLARLGGDEFAVLLPDCAEGDLYELASRLRGGLAYESGCAVGAVTWRPGETAEALLRRADTELYRDKLAPQGSP